MRFHRTALAILALLGIACSAPLHAEPIRAAYLYGYMGPDHLDSLAAAGFNRALVKMIGDSLGSRQRSELKGWIERGRRLGADIAPAWSIMAPSRVSARPPDRRYVWGAGTFEKDIACPLDSAFWKSAIMDRIADVRLAFPEITHLHVDLETYVGSRTHYNAGACRCRSCLAEYAQAIAGMPKLVPIEEYEETRLTQILTAEWQAMKAAHPGVEITFFDLDLPSFVHRSMARALVAAEVPTANFTERTYRLGPDAIQPARDALMQLGLEIPLVGGLSLQRFTPLLLSQAMQSMMERADGCFIFTTYSLWQQQAKLTGSYVLQAPQIDYWTAVREGFYQADLEPSDVRVTPNPMRPGESPEVRFTIYNRGRLGAPDSRWVLSCDSVAIAEDDTPVPAQGSVAIAITLAPNQPPGRHVFRIVLDAFQRVSESNETNNARSLAVVALEPETVPTPPTPPTPPSPPSPPPFVERAFPSTPVLDNFDRSSGPVGGSWAAMGGATVSSKRFKPTTDLVTGIWMGATPGSEQEAYVMFPDVTSTSSRQGLLLKIQGDTPESGAIEVRYDAVRRLVIVATYTPGVGWEDRGPGFATKITDDDVLGARAHADGNVEVYRNGLKLGIRSVAGWPFAERGGRIGFILHQALKTRLDNFGGGDISATTAGDPRPVQTPFPSTPMIDDFTRRDAPLGSPWTGLIDGIVVSSGRFKPTHSRILAAVWDGVVPGADQEAYVKLLKFTSGSPRQGLLLKVQGTTVDSGAIEVRYDSKQKKVFVATFTPGVGWEDRGAGMAMRFTDGDVLGARAFASGQVEVYRNGLYLDARSVAGWSFVDRPGRIGITLQNASSTRMDDFGGGTFTGTPALNGPPDEGLGTSEGPKENRPGPAPAMLELGAAAPNPFASATRVRFGMPREGAARLSIYDVQGRHVTTLVDGVLSPGWHSAHWDGRGRHGEQMAAGVYLVLLEAAGEVRSRKAVLTR